MSCGDSGGGNQVGETSTTYENTKDGTTYKLTVTQSAGRAAYVPAKGDTYVLLIITGTGTKTSRGTVTNISNGVFTLKPANAAATFDVTTSGNAINNISGPITLEGSGGTVQGPGDLQAGGDPTNPSNPTNPTNPANPSNPANPANPVNLSNPFTSWEALAAWLKAQPNNTQANPYSVKVNVSDIPEYVSRTLNTATMLDAAPINYASETLKQSIEKYFNLDLSGSTFTSIRPYALALCLGLTSVTIPNSVTKIGYWAFLRCKNLTTIIVPSSVTNIGREAFYNCEKLTSVTFQGTISRRDGWYDDAFMGNLDNKFYATDKDKGTPGT